MKGETNEKKFIMPRSCVRCCPDITSGNVSAYASFDRKATSASCTITLQEKYNGAWRNATGVPVKIYRKTITNSYSISAARTFTLVKGKVYRAKIRFVDTNSTGTYYKTRYTGSF